MSSVSVSQLKFCLFKRREKLIRILFTCGKYVVILSLSRCGGMTKRRMTFQTRRKLRFKKAVDRTKNMKALFFPPPLSLHDCNTQEKLKQWLCHFFIILEGGEGEARCIMVYMCMLKWWLILFRIALRGTDVLLDCFWTCLVAIKTGALDHKDRLHSRLYAEAILT